MHNKAKIIKLLKEEAEEEFHKILTRPKTASGMRLAALDFHRGKKLQGIAQQLEKF